MEDKNKRCQVSFDLAPEMRQAIKIVAAKRNISMNLWVVRAIYRALQKESGGEVAPPPNQRK
jgi:predicted HicB family RNase H-like nuclease